MKICIYDKNMRENFLDKLQDKYILIPTVKLSISEPLNTHPDIQIAKISKNSVVVDPSVFDYYYNLLSRYDIIVHKGKMRVKEPYPYDSIYNLASNGKISIHNFEITDEVLKNAIDFEKVDVKQGYAKCNVLFTKKGVITSDAGIYNKLKDERKLLITPGFIDLEGYEYGFIGGASGFDDCVYFLGDVRTHKDFLKIKSFLDEEKTDFVNLGEGNLKDYGSLIFLEGGD